MDEIKNYVEKLFANEKTSIETSDLKDEIYSNMVAKKNDLIEQGIDSDEAMLRAKESVLSIQNILGDSHEIYINRFYTECLQNLLLGSVIFWILTIPTMLFKGSLTCIVAFLLVAVLGVAYLISRRKEEKLVVTISRKRCQKAHKILWIIWGISFVVCVATISAVTFASSLWYGNSIDITGPYQFGQIAIRYYIAVLTVVFPIAISSSCGLLKKYERVDEDEQNQ